MINVARQTPDRLLSALSLAAQGGMIVRDDTNVEPRFMAGSS